MIFSSLILVCGVVPAQSTNTGTIHPGDTSALNFTGALNSPGGNTAESTCMDSGPAQSCETYTLMVSGAPSDWTGKTIQVLLTWQLPSDEYDLYIHKGDLTGPVVNSAIQGPDTTQQVTTIDPATGGTGLYTIHIAYDTTPSAAADHYTGSIAVLTAGPGGGGFVAPPAVTLDTSHYVGYENYEVPGVVTPVTSTSSGGLTVEYMGRNAGEPSVGSNWLTGVANFQSDLETLFITFDDSCPANGQSASWVNNRAPTSTVIDSDPIGFTDRDTGRVFASELTLLSPNTVKISHSDDDGASWMVDQSGGLASAVDHQTIGGGPYHSPLTGGIDPLYKNAVYYCSQDIAAALCSRSDDGGQTYGPSVAIYNLTDCGGLHGHVKVSPKDGTVYVPNRGCGSQSAVAVSQDNGTTWTVNPIQDAANTVTSSTDDPSVGIDAGGRVYALFADNGTSAAVATTDDFGATWQNLADLSPVFGLKNVAFPAAVAGDAGRAAVAFYGTTTDGTNSGDPSFTGVWHLYVAQTFDGGKTWTLNDVTSQFPMQRSGLLRGSGTVTRNLLDFFDITIDRDGRVLVGYVNGCPGAACATAAPTAIGNDYSATATIARQSSGLRLIGAKDPKSTNSVPGIPFLLQRRTDEAIHLSWNEADTGNSPISSYSILRGTASNKEAATAIASVAGNVARFDDFGATDPTQTYYYKVVANNAVGASCGNNEVVAPYVGNPCIGTIVHKNPAGNPEATGGSAGAGAPPMPSLLIDTIAVAEPFGAQNLVFKMKVGDLSSVPASSRWRMVWNWPSAAGNQYYVGMKTDASGTVTYEYGTVFTDTTAVVVGIPTETMVGAADPSSGFTPDGTISIVVPKSVLGNPQVGDLLGAFNGRTFTGDTAGTETLERSTILFDHTFVKGQVDSAYPAATYRVVGNQVTAFTFAEQDNVATGATVVSNTVTIVDNTDPQPVSIVNGEYSINGGAFSSALGQIKQGDTLTVRQTSSASATTSNDATVTVGCYSTKFRTVTAAAGTTSGGSSGGSSGGGTATGGSSGGSTAGGSSGGTSSGGSSGGTTVGGSTGGSTGGGEKRKRGTGAAISPWISLALLAARLRRRRKPH